VFTWWVCQHNAIVMPQVTRALSLDEARKTSHGCETSIKKDATKRR
jgi:hypothetical protein